MVIFAFVTSGQNEELNILCDILVSVLEKPQVIIEKKIELKMACKVITCFI